MKEILANKIVIGLTILVAIVAGIVYIDRPSSQPLTGSFNPTGGGTYRLQSSIGTSNTTITLSSFKEPVSNIKYTMTYLNSTILYGTLDPQTSKPEFISASGITQNSDGTAVLTGVTRGLTRTPAGSDCVASTTLAQSHAAQSIFILSDSPCFFREYLTANQAATSSALLIFSSTTPPRYDQVAAQHTGTYIATTSEFASIDYVNQTVLSGGANATEVVKGIGELATQLESASSTTLGGTGAGLILQAKYATSSPSTVCGLCIMVTGNGGKMSQSFLDLTSTYAWTGLHNFVQASSTRFSVFDTLYVGGSATSTFQGATTGTSTIRGFLNITGTNSSSTISGGLVVSATTTLTGCIGCLNAYESVTNTGGGPTANQGTGSVTASCTSGKKVISGGGSNSVPSQLFLDGSSPSGTTGWTASYTCSNGGGACSANTITAYAICAYP